MPLARDKTQPLSRLRARMAGIAAVAASASIAFPAAAQDRVFLTPTEYVFANLGRAAGQGISGAISIAATNAAIEARVNRARNAFHGCFPDCGESITQELSFALLQRDLKLLEHGLLKSAGGPAMAEFNQALDILGLGGPGSSVTDRCQQSFDRWANRYNREMGVGTSGNPIENIIGMATRGGLHEDGLMSTREEYRDYQACRDGEEIELAEALQ